MKKDRPYNKHFEFSEYEYRCMQALMEKCGYTKEAALIRDLVKNCVPVEKPAEGFNEKIMVLRNLGSNLNQIAKNANAGGFVAPEDMEYVIELAREIKQYIVDLKRITYEPYRRRDIRDVISDAEYEVFEDEQKNIRLKAALDELRSLLNEDSC